MNETRKFITVFRRVHTEAAEYCADFHFRFCVLWCQFSGRKLSLNSNKEFILHPCQVVCFRNKPRGKCLHLCLSLEFRDSRNLQRAIHMAALMSLDRSVTKKFQILEIIRNH